MDRKIMEQTQNLSHKRSETSKVYREYHRSMIPEGFLSASEAAFIKDVSLQTIINRCRQGKIVAKQKKIRGINQWIIPESSL